MAVRKVAITLPEELYDMVERARKIEHRTRSEMIQEALRSHFGEPVYVPTEQERQLLAEALADARQFPDAGSPWETVRRDVWPDA
ncbi:ribbon-helix-helix protein, CopG family [Microlunatus sp. GCM10028923]|uniref:ribbon-helix-helix protein, CopG family n=1 Tax=Microlunatus sp. GCM10028923 TaxID=3273400 RepID=UPI0036128B37